MANTNLNITIRVNGRQAQKQLQAVGQQINQIQNMVGKRLTTAGASSPWSPTIAKRMASQAAAAAKQASAAQQKVLNQAWKVQTNQARIAAAQQNKVLQQAWNRQQAAHKASQQTQLRQQKRANAQALAQQKTHAAQMSKLGGLTPMGFASNVQQSQLINAGKNINWVGRQLTYNFTLPLAAAGVGLFRFTMDIKRSTTQLSKVYGDVSEDQNMLKAEVDALGESFKLLSTYFGVNQVEVIDIAAAWAAAGSAGRGLAENTRATLETMILGDMEAQEAIEGLIALQAQWGFSTVQNADDVSELTIQLAHLNSIENATGISTGQLIDVIQRAGGTARTSGLELRELAALAAALVPATGDAAQAGTALRSIISSLMAPTAAASEALELMGITVTDPSFMGEDVMGRLKLVAEHFNNLSDAQKGVVSSTIATKWQVSRFDVLMRALEDPLSFYNRALDVTRDETQSLETRTRELNEVLKSHPRQFDIMTNAMKNALADAFVPMIPAIMSIVGLIADLAIAFSELPDSTKQTILIILTLVAVLGPLMSFLGSTMQLFGVFGAMFKPVGKMVWWFIQRAIFPLIEALFLLSVALIRTAMTALGSFIVALGPWGWAVIAVIAAVVAAILIILHTDLEDQIWDIIQSIADAFGKLPGIIGRVFQAIGRLLARWWADIWEFLQVLNPFHRSSPSLVDNVKAGVAVILDEYKKLGRIPELIRSASSALQAFSTATDPQGRTFREIELQKKADVTTSAIPAARPAANALVQGILALEAALPNLAVEITAQERVVANWTAALKAADLQVDTLREGLEVLEEEYESIGNQITAAQDRIAELADTPIAGMRALEDQIFNNTHQQNLLNLELLEFERQGITIDSIRDKYAAMAGELETLRGTQAELREAGAGSDILGWYDQQIDAIERQRGEMGEVERTIIDIEKRLDALDLEQRFLELTKAINFDPLQRQIDQIANSVTEMPFDEIVRQILEQQAIVTELQPRYDELGAAVERERDAVEAAVDARDAISDSLDVEQEKLTALEQAYSDIEGLIRDMESALTDFASLLEDAADDASRLQELFEAGEGFDFEDFGGTQALGREGWLEDIEAFNKELDDELARLMETMGKLDLLTPLKEGWEKVKTWFQNLDWGEIASRLWSGVTSFLSNFWSQWWPLILGALGVAVAFIFGGWAVGLIIAAGLLIGGAIATFGGDLWDWVYEHVIDPAWDAGWEFISGLWEGFKEKAGEVWDKLTGWFWTFWDWVKTFFGVHSPSTLFFGLGVDIIQGLINGFISMITTIGGWFAGFGVQIWQWAYDNIFSPVMNAVSPLADTIGTVFDGVGAAIDLVWQNVIKPIWTEIKSFIDDKLVPAFEWLWQRGTEVWDLLGAAIKKVYDEVISPVLNGIQWTIDNVVIPAFETAWTTIMRIWNGIATGLKTVWDLIIEPIFNGIKGVFENTVQPAFEFLRDNVIKPIMEAIFSIIAHGWNLVNGVLEAGVNFFVTAFNLLGDAVNAVAGFLHIDAEVPDAGNIHLDDINTSITWPEGFARGGVTDPAGGIYNTPHAIVGEGSRSWPEYVIPTDPRYRDSAIDLLRAAGTRMLQGGGVVDGGDSTDPSQQFVYNPVFHEFDRRSAVQKAMDAISGAGGAIVNGAVRAAWLGPSLLARAAIDLIPNRTIKGFGDALFNVADSWVTHIGKDWDAESVLRIPPTVAKGPGSWQAIVDYLKQNRIPHKVLSTYRPGAVTRNTGKPSWHGMNRAIDLSGPEGMINFSPSTERIAASIYAGFKGQLHELIWGGTQKYNVFEGANHAYSGALMREHYNHVHASLQQGGRFYVPHVPGGVNLNIAEGRSGEQVQILPVDERGEGGTTIVINGNLEFPNIKSGDDAKDFINNLRALAAS